VESLVQANFLLGSFSHLDGMPKIRPAVNQLHNDEDLLIETVGVGSLFDAVSFDNVSMSKASRYHRPLLEAVDSGPVSAVTSPDSLDCDILVREVVVGLVNDRLAPFSDFLHNFIMVVPDFVCGV